MRRCRITDLVTSHDVQVSDDVGVELIPTAGSTMRVRLKGPTERIEYTGVTWFKLYEPEKAEGSGDG